MAAPAADGQDLTPRVYRPGDTLIAEDTVFVFTRAAVESLRVEQKRDSIRIATLRADVDNLEAQRDSFRSAWMGCKIEKNAWQAAADAHKQAQEAYEEKANDGLGGFLFDGPSGFAIGNITGLTAGVLACRGANP